MLRGGCRRPAKKEGEEKRGEREKRRGVNGGRKKGRKGKGTSLVGVPLEDGGVGCWLLLMEGRCSPEKRRDGRPPGLLAGAGVLAGDWWLLLSPGISPVELLVGVAFLLASPAGEKGE